MKLLLVALSVLAARGGWLSSQEPGPAPAPTRDASGEAAIVILLARPRGLDVESFRRSLANVLEARVASEPTAQGAWVQGDGTALRGGRDAGTWRLRQIEAQALRESEVVHLDEADRDVLRLHRSRLVISTQAASDEKSRRAAYALLGPIAAAALGRDVLGIGAVDHGTFDVFDGDAETLTQDLIGKDPLRALAPTMMSSLVLLLEAPRKLEPKALRAALAKELGIEFSEVDSKGDEDHFVIAEESLAVISLGEAMVFLTVGPRWEGAPDATEGDAELRSRTALEKHRAILHLATAGPPGPAAELARRQRLARIAAALWGADVLGLNWHCHRALVPAVDGLAERLRAQDPVEATLEGIPVPIVRADDEAAMQRAIAEARASWEQAAAHFRAGGEVSAKFPFPTRSGSVEHIWISVEALDGTTVRGKIANEPHDLEGLELGSPVSCKLAELSDWLFEKDGRQYGGYTVKVLGEQQRRKREDKR